MFNIYQPGVPTEVIDTTIVGSTCISLTRLESGEYFVEMDGSDFNLGTILKRRYQAKRVFRKHVGECVASEARKAARKAKQIRFHSC